MLLAIGIIVAAILGFMPIYDYDVWSVRKKILIHTLAMFVTIYPALLISGWYEGDFGYLFALGSFAIFGAIFVTVGYLLSKYVFKNIPDNK